MAGAMSTAVTAPVVPTARAAGKVTAPAAPDVDHAFAGHERECVDETLRDRREERHPALVVVVGELVEEPRDEGGRIVSIVHPPMVAESGDRRETRPRVLRGEHRMRG
jgi:hypothetical protein